MQSTLHDESITRATDILRTLDLAPLDDAFQVLVDVAADARQAFEEFTMEYEGELVAIGREGALWKVTNLGPNTATRAGVYRPDMPFPSAPSYESHLPCINESLEGMLEGHEEAMSWHVNLPPVILTSHVDRVNIPVFGTRGEIVTRDNWSSSLASLAGYNGVSPPNAPGEILETPSSERWSPAESDGAWGWLPSTPSQYGDMASSRSESSASQSNSGFSFTSRYEFYDNRNCDLLDSLTMWVERGAAHQHDHCCFKNEMAVEPLHQAIQMLYSPLSNLVDYLTMAGQGVKDIVAMAFPTYEHAVASLVPNKVTYTSTWAVSNEPPSYTSTSPDYTLPVSTEHPGAQIATTWNRDLIEEPDRDGWRHIMIPPPWQPPKPLLASIISPPPSS
ncbi:hypothetical protein K438DRAFT_618875 [Mycena galopus ATCC 62051]|nr:hypothetical protein K438DRAFT_618875 [Mycena galopus ATCC 62051]